MQLVTIKDVNTDHPNGTEEKFETRIDIVEDNNNNN